MKIITCVHLVDHFSEVIDMLHYESMIVLRQKYEIDLKNSKEGSSFWVKPSFEMLGKDAAKAPSLTLTSTPANILESDLKRDAERCSLRNRTIRLATVRYGEILGGLD